MHSMRNDQRNELFVRNLYVTTNKTNLFVHLDDLQLIDIKMILIYPHCLPLTTVICHSSRTIGWMRHIVWNTSRGRDDIPWCVLSSWGNAVKMVSEWSADWSRYRDRNIRTTLWQSWTTGALTHGVLCGRKDLPNVSSILVIWPAVRWPQSVWSQFLTK